MNRRSFLSTIPAGIAAGVVVGTTTPATAAGPSIAHRMYEAMYRPADRVGTLDSYEKRYSDQPHEEFLINKISILVHIARWEVEQRMPGYPPSKIVMVHKDHAQEALEGRRHWGEDDRLLHQVFGEYVLHLLRDDVPKNRIVVASCESPDALIRSLEWTE